MVQPAPDFNCVLTLIGVSLAVWVHDWTTACFDFCFDLHVAPPLTVVVYTSPYTAFNSSFCFHSALLSPTN